MGMGRNILNIDSDTDTHTNITFKKEWLEYTTTVYSNISGGGGSILLADLFQDSYSV